MESHLVNQIHKFTDYYRKNGFLWVCRHIITNLLHFNKLYVFETEIDKNHQIVKAEIPIHIRFLTKSDDDIDRLTKFWPPEHYAPPFSTPEMINTLIKQRLAAGDEYLIAEHNGDIIHMSWMGFYNAHMFEPYEKPRGLKPGEAIGHSAYCDENYRGNHIMSAVRSNMLDILHEKQYEKLVSYVDPNNAAAIAINKRFNGKVSIKLYLLKILGFGIHFSSRRAH